MLFCLPQEEASHFPIEGNREDQILDNVAVHLDPTAGWRAGAAAFVIRSRLLWLTGAQQGDDERPIAFPIAGRRPDRHGPVRGPNYPCRLGSRAGDVPFVRRHFERRRTACGLNADRHAIALVFRQAAGASAGAGATALPDPPGTLYMQGNRSGARR